MCVCVCVCYEKSEISPVMAYPTYSINSNIFTSSLNYPIELMGNFLNGIFVAALPQVNVCSRQLMTSFS